MKKEHPKGCSFFALLCVCIQQLFADDRLLDIGHLHTARRKLDNARAAL